MHPCNELKDTDEFCGFSLIHRLPILSEVHRFHGVICSVICTAGSQDMRKKIYAVSH